MHSDSAKGLPTQYAAGQFAGRQPESLTMEEWHDISNRNEDLRCICREVLRPVSTRQVNKS